MAANSPAVAFSPTSPERPTARSDPPAKANLAPADNRWQGSEFRTSLDRVATASSSPPALGVNLPSAIASGGGREVLGPGKQVAIASNFASNPPIAPEPQQLPKAPAAGVEPTWPPIHKHYTATADDFEFRGKAVFLTTRHRSAFEDHCNVAVRQDQNGNFTAMRTGPGGATGSIDLGLTGSTVLERTGSHSFAVTVRDPPRGPDAKGERRDAFVHCYFEFNVSQLGCSVQQARIATSQGVGEHRPEKTDGACRISDEAVGTKPTP
jgi:hypothetical protein